jgi:hypothetical protein
MCNCLNFLLFISQGLELEPERQIIFPSRNRVKMMQLRNTIHIINSPRVSSKTVTSRSEFFLNKSVPGSSMEPHGGTVCQSSSRFCRGAPRWNSVPVKFLVLPRSPTVGQCASHVPGSAEEPHCGTVCQSSSRFCRGAPQ